MSVTVHFIQDIQNELNNIIDTELSGIVNTSNLTQQNIDDLKANIYSYIIGTKLLKMVAVDALLHCIHQDHDDVAIVRVTPVDSDNDGTNESFIAQCEDVTINAAHKAVKERDKKLKDKKTAQTVEDAAAQDPNYEEYNYAAALTAFFNALNT